MNQIAWSKRGENILVARIVMNGIPLYAAYNSTSRFLGLRIDTCINHQDVTAPTFRIRNGFVFASRRNVCPSAILGVIYEILDGIPLLAPTAQA
jgi:hypothetical protein